MKHVFSPNRLVMSLRRFHAEELHPGILLGLFYLKWAMDARDAQSAMVEGAAHSVDAAVRLPADARWEALSAEGPVEITERMLDLFTQVEALNPELAGMMADLVGNAEFVLRRTPRSVVALAYAVEQFGRTTLFPSDAGGREEVFRCYRQLAENYFSSRAVEQSVPSTMLCRLLVELAQPAAGEIVFDPWASWGETLRYALKHQNEQGEDEDLAAGVFGFTNNPMMLRVAKMLADVSRKEQPHLSARLPNFEDDDECDELREGVDFVLSAPQLGAPFSTQELENLDSSRRLGVLGAGESNAINFALELVHDQGAVLLALPPFVLNRGQQMADMRLELLQKDLVDSVILLPMGATARYSIRTAVLILRKEKPVERRGKVFFVTVPDTSVRSRRFSALEQGVFREVVDSYRQYEELEGFSVSVDVEEILAVEGDLNPSRYTVDLRSETANVAELRLAIEAAELTRDAANDALESVFARLTNGPG